MAVTFGPPQKEESEKKRELDGRKLDGSRLETKPESKEKPPETTRTKLDQLKPEFKDFILYGVKILREREPETNTIKFYEGSKEKPILNLQEWIKNKLKKDEKKKIEDGLKPYEAFFKELNISESEKQTRLKALKDQCFKLHEQGKTPQKLDEIPLNINLVLKRITVSQFSVDASAEKITIPYALVMPPHVSTIIITRENNKNKEKIQIVCVKYGPKGNEHFLEAETGKAIFLKPNDIVDIAAVTTPETAPVKAEAVSSDVKPQASAGGGGYYGGGGGGGGAGAGNSGSSETGAGLTQKSEADKKTDKTEEEKPKMTNQDISAAKKDTKETNENYGIGDFNVKKLESREFNGGRPIHLCTFPKKLDPNKKTRFILYFHGFGDSRTKADDIFKNRQATGGLEKFTKEKNENIVFVMPQGEKNESGAGNYFNETVSGGARIENMVNYSLSVAFEGKNPPDAKVDKYLMGHSGANYAMEKALQNLPANYFKGIGLFDSLYSQGTGEKYADLLSKKHIKTDVYSVYRKSGGPGNNNPVLANAISSRTEGPKGKFETRPAGSDHSAMKYPGISDAISYFASQEKPETSVQPAEPTTPSNPDQKTA